MVDVFAAAAVYPYSMAGAELPTNTPLNGGGGFAARLNPDAAPFRPGQRVSAAAVASFRVARLNRKRESASHEQKSERVRVRIVVTLQYVAALDQHQHHHHHQPAAAAPPPPAALAGYAAAVYPYMNQQVSVFDSHMQLSIGFLFSWTHANSHFAVNQLV